MKKFELKHAIPLLILLLVVACGSIAFFVSNQGVKYSVSDTSNTYREYVFDSNEEGFDMGFTHRVLQHIRVQENMFTEEAASAENNEVMKRNSLTDEDKKRGVIERRSAGADIYELRSDDGEVITDSYSVFKNNELLFGASMNFGANGPIFDWRIVNGDPALTYNAGCDEEECRTEIFFAGRFMSKVWNVKNPKYLFAYGDKVGFVATDDGADKIFFDENFITPAFDSIHTHNCCALNEILLTVYDNGALLFYGKRGEQDYLGEVALHVGFSHMH